MSGVLQMLHWSYSEGNENDHEAQRRLESMDTNHRSNGRMRGNFGFVRVENGSIPTEVFLHRHAIASKRDPQIGDTLEFDVVRDSQDRVKAVDATYVNAPNDATNDAPVRFGVAS
jgi:cold shock CspA family protein